MKQHLQQTVQSNYGNLELLISEEANNQRLIATATLNQHVVHQWERPLEEGQQVTKGDIQGLKKNALDELKRDEHLQRKLKLSARRQSGKIAFPNQVERSHNCEQLQQEFATLDKAALEQETNKQQHFSLCGRIINKRNMGKAGFAQLRDGYGNIQLYLTREQLGEAFQEFKQWDSGDIVNVSGFLFRTDTGELTLHCLTIKLLTKSLKPLPDKYHGLKDIEQRYRQRYVDLLSNEESRHTFVMRTKIIKTIRQFFDDFDFMEVETPMLHPIPGGATARPFITHHNALDMDVYLRIAPELYLKRLIVGGFERVYEINRNFRNEGLSTRHNPEFSMIEFYQAYADYQDLMTLTEQLFISLCEKVIGNTQLEYQGDSIDFTPPFKRLSMKDAILAQHPKLPADTLENETKCRTFAKSLNIHCDEETPLGKIITEIFEESVEHTLIQPTFITQYPIEVSPLARRNDEDPSITDRFEFFIAGREIANGFSELNDAEDQAARFREQVESLGKGDDEAMHYDQDYINALEYGMPPTAGEGIGIDRLVMLFTNAASIRDVLLFPHMRPEHSSIDNNTE